MKNLLFLLVCLALLVAVATAQVQNGQFTGTVVDPSGAAIPNAKVKITNVGTGLTVATTTNQTGSYTASQLPVGTYTLNVEAPGFKKLTNANVPLNAGSITHVDFKMQLGEATQTVEVTGAASAVETESSQLAQVVTGAQVANLPLNGRNVYDLIQMAPGAVNVNGVDFENGHGTVVNGLREDFNGFLVNGVSNKGLSGGVVNVPIQDTVQEFQQLTLNNSAQYGSSAGSTTNLVTKSGTNDIHGSAWDFVRNDKFDANEFFLNQVGFQKPALRFNQFGGTLGGPIVKDKLFFFLAYQQDHFNTTAPPITTISETPEFRNAVIGTPALSNTVANLLYKNFAPSVPVTYSSSGCAFIAQGPTGMPIITPAGYDPVNNPEFTEKASGVSWVDSRINALNANLPVFTTPGSGIPFECPSVALFKQQVQTIGNLFQGKEASGRIDFQPSDRNRFFVQFNWLRSTDQFGPCDAACTRGFTNPTRNILPNGAASWVHTFGPKVVN